MQFFFEEDWALSAFTSCYGEQWADFPTGHAVVRLQLCHRALLECPARWHLAASLPAPGWHQLQNLRHNSATPAQALPPPSPCPWGMLTHLNSTWAHHGPSLAHSIITARAGLWSKTFSYYSQNSQRCLTALLGFFLIGKEIKKYFINLLLNLQHWYANIKSAPKEKLLALKNERISLVVLHWPQLAAQHHTTLPMFTSLPSRTEEENRKNRRDQTYESKQRQINRQQKGKPKPPEICEVWSNGPSTLNFTSQPLCRAQWLFKLNASYPFCRPNSTTFWNNII